MCVYRLRQIKGAVNHFASWATEGWMSAQENLWVFSVIKLPELRKSTKMKQQEWEGTTEMSCSDPDVVQHKWSVLYLIWHPLTLLGLFCPPHHLFFPMFQNLPHVSGRDIPKAKSKRRESNVTSSDTCGIYRDVQFLWKREVPWRTGTLGCEDLQGPSWWWCSCFGCGGFAGCWQLSLKCSQWGGLWLRNISKPCFGHIRPIWGQPGDARGRFPVSLFWTEGSTFSSFNFRFLYYRLPSSQFNTENPNSHWRHTNISQCFSPHPEGDPEEPRSKSTC